MFAICPVDSFPGLAVEPVTDSSRYFVLRLKDPSGKNYLMFLFDYLICSSSLFFFNSFSFHLFDIGRQAFVGLGFQDRGDAFDFNVALQEHFK